MCAVEETKGHKGTEELRLLARKALMLDGVIDILAFDTAYALLSTSLGVLTVEGEGLRIEKSDVTQGTLALSGRVDALIWSEDTPSKKKGLFGRSK